MAKGEAMEIDNQIKSELSPGESFWWLKFVPQPNIWTNVNIFRFLRLYQTYPLLWDPNNQKYSKSLERSRAYGEISKKLNLQGVHENELMKLIESLKKIYIEEKQKREEAKSSLKKYKPPPVWFQVLNNIVESIMNNEKEKASSDSNINEIKTESTELIQCFKIRRDNIWTPNCFKTDLWKLYVPKTSYATEEEKENIIIVNNEDITNESSKALKSSKSNYNSEFQNIFQDSLSHNCQNIKKYCPDFDNILSDCSSHSSSLPEEKKYCPELKNTFRNRLPDSIQKAKKYCPELKNILCACSSKSKQNIKKYCPELTNILCNCSSDSIQKEKFTTCHCSSKSRQNINKYCLELKNCLRNLPPNSIEKSKTYCPELKDILCDCSSKSSQNIKKHCPEFKNIICDCSSQSSQSVKKYSPEFEYIACDCSSETKYSPENKNLDDNSWKSSSDSKINSDSRRLKDVRIIYKRLKYYGNKKKYQNPYDAEFDRYCYYKDWNKYYNIRICDSEQYYEEPLQPKKKSDVSISNQKPPRPHKNNILESDINLFSDKKQNYEFHLYDCIEKISIQI